ncbi:universal stress protein [Kribbella sp. NPDC050124]|uniref:universal stress protein n=1 Tax=Kribbella sp. NPDC050124 TaxID=3364114 RepID=UPI0037A21CE2
MPSKPVIHVGVDDSRRDTGALEWALQESTLRQEPLQSMQVMDGKARHASAGALATVAADGRMLVVGRREIGAFRRLLTGSTSAAVAVEAQVPVVIVPEHWRPSDHAGPVLVALDDSDENAAVIEFAIAEAAERGLPVRFVHVWDLPAIYSWDAMNVAGVSAEWTENAERHFENVAVEWRAKHPEATVQVSVRRGHVVDGVVTAAEEADAQLLVVGTRHHTRLASFLLGPVTRGVLHHTPCPLAIVPVA